MDERAGQDVSAEPRGAGISSIAYGGWVWLRRATVQQLHDDKQKQDRRDGHRWAITGSSHPVIAVPLSTRARHIARRATGLTRHGRAGRHALQRAAAGLPQPPASPPRGCHQIRFYQRFAPLQPLRDVVAQPLRAPLLLPPEPHARRRQRSHRAVSCPW